jgi:opacity protein-like surface antigen
MKRYVVLFTLAFCVLSAPAAKAQSHLGLESIGGSIGFVSPENLGSTFSLGAFADWGTIAPNVGLESHLEYWSKSESSFGFESSIRDVILGAHARYYFETAGPAIRPFAGAGLGMHFFRSEVSIPSFFPGLPAMSTSDSQTKFGLDLGGGFAAAVGPRTDLVGEAWYGIVSDVSQLSLHVGLSYKLGS